MRILAIETSCDDTAVAILEGVGGKVRLLADIISSQVKVHAPFGGVVPDLASRAHTENFLPCLKRALNKSSVGLKDIDLIAVTHGPGLIPSLLIGVNAAKALSYVLNKPIIGINHIEGHIIANWLELIGDKSKAVEGIIFPAACLVVSGGHTQLVLVKKIGDYQIIGETRDDAAGEAFDKVAKLLNLGYPGGPIISQRAQVGNAQAISLPRPMFKTKDYDFSFSGLKTAVLYEVKNHRCQLGNDIYINDLCASFQQAVVDVLVEKTIRAAKAYEVRTIMLSGGVAANDLLRITLGKKSEENNFYFSAPAKNFCTDNGAMIALAAYYRQKETASWQEIKADANLKL